MEKIVIVLNSDQKECEKLCAMLQKKNYMTIPLHSQKNLNDYVQDNGCRAIIIDLDTVPVDTRDLTGLKKSAPNVNIVGLSERPFHPELKEAISYSMYACLSKPVDLDELKFWLKSIFEDDMGIG